MYPGRPFHTIRGIVSVPEQIYRYVVASDGKEWFVKDRQGMIVKSAKTLQEALEYVHSQIDAGVIAVFDATTAELLQLELKDNIIYVVVDEGVVLKMPFAGFFLIDSMNMGALGERNIIRATIPGLISDLLFMNFPSKLERDTGSGFSEISDPHINQLFLGDCGYYPVQTGIVGLRFTWDNVEINTAYYLLVVGIDVSTGGNKAKVVAEVSSDGTSWTTIGESDYTKYEGYNVIVVPLNFQSNYTYLRITLLFERANPYPLYLHFVRMLVTYAPYNQFRRKVLTWTENNEAWFQITAVTKDVRPRADNAYDVGTSSARYKDAYFAGKVRGASGVVTKVDVGDYGGNFANYTPPTGEEGLMVVAIDTNATSPGKRLYIYANGQWNYVDLT